MVWSYEYTPYVWPVLASVALSTVLLIQGIRYRSAPGAVPFVALVAGILAWTLANGLATVGTNDPTRFFWFKFQTALSLPTVTAGLCFAVEYAGLGRLLTRRTVALLAVVPLACALLILTDSAHHLMWTRIWFDGYVRCDKGIASWWAIVYAYSLSVLHLLVLAWLFVRSPRHRGIAAALILTALTVRCVSFFKFTNWAPVLRFDPMVVVTAFALLPYAVAVFRFRMFDVVPVARNLIIEQMADAMIVLDAGNRIADLNRAAETLLGAVRSRAVGRHVAEALPSRPDLLALIDSPAKPQCEVSLGNNRFYQVSIAPLIDERGFHLGRLVSLHEITELKRAQDQILDHQRTLAMLNERELLARELHGDHMSDLCHIYCFGPSQDRKSPLYVFSHGNSTVANPTGTPATYDDGVVAYCENLRKAMRWHTESFSFLSTGYQSYTRPTQESWGLPVPPVPVGDDDASDGYALIPIELDWTKRGDVKDDNVAYNNPETGVKITHFPVIHARKGSIGFKLEWNGLSMIYTGDTKPETNFLDQVNNHKDADGNPKAIDVAIHEMIVPAEVWAMKSLGLSEPGSEDDPTWVAAYNTAVTVQNSSHTPQGAFGYLLSQMPRRPRLAVATHFPVADDTVASALTSVQAHVPEMEQGKDITWSFDRMVIRVTAAEIKQLRANVSDFTFSPLPAEMHNDINTPKYHTDANASDPYAQLDRNTEILCTEEGGEETYRQDGY